jgi:hypothetical protein
MKTLDHDRHRSTDLTVTVIALGAVATFAALGFMVALQ